MGHPLQCSTGNCESTLRLLRQAAVHHSVIRNLLGSIYTAHASSKFIDKIDTGFSSGCIESVKEAIKCDNLIDLLIESVPDNEYSEVPSTPSCDEVNEAALQVKYADTVCEYEKKLQDDPEFACCSCEHLLMRKNLTMFKYHNGTFNSEIWHDLKDYLIQNDPSVAEKPLYVCT